LLFAMVLNHSRNQHALAETELFDHRPGDEGIGPLTIEIGRRVAEKAVAVGVHLEDARSGGQRQIVAVGAVELAALILVLGPPTLAAAVLTAPLALTAAAGAMAIALVASAALASALAATVVILPSAESTAGPLLLTHARENPKS
jgi:hypothetical protein